LLRVKLILQFLVELLPGPATISGPLCAIASGSELLEPFHKRRLLQSQLEIYGSLCSRVIDVFAGSLKPEYFNGHRPRSWAEARKRIAAILITDGRNSLAILLGG
jgi:hypothetical protein